MRALKTLELFVQPLEVGKIPYFVTGSTASIFYGEPRLTLDVDVVIHLDQRDTGRFIQLFADDSYYCPPAEVIRIECARRSHGHFNLIHPESGLKADVYPATEDPLHQWALQNRRRESLGDHLTIWLAPPEYVIIRKLEYFREGGSEKHLSDIRGMLSQLPQETLGEFFQNEIQSRGLFPLWEKLRR